MTLIGFFDDDIVLEPDALEKMMNFWEGDQGRTGGAAFNMRNHPLLEAAPLKAMPLTERIGLYSSGPGRVMPSGFQTMIGSVKRTTPVQWLSTGASTFRRVIFNEFEFDQWFEGYSYLEDLDFSYRVGKKYRLAVVADAGFYHFPGPTGRGSGVEFGRREVLNRAHFVKKNRELSLPRCYLALTIRSLLSFSQAVRSFRGYAWQRVWGNLLGFASLIKR